MGTPEVQIRLETGRVDKTVITNLVEISNRLRRPCKLIMSYLSINLQTPTLSCNSLRGHFVEYRIENALDEFIEECVLCVSCLHERTNIKRDLTLKCLTCGHARSLNKKGRFGLVLRHMYYWKTKKVASGPKRSNVVYLHVVLLGNVQRLKDYHNTPTAYAVL